MEGEKEALPAAQNGTEASQDLVCSHRVSSLGIFGMSPGGGVWSGATEEPHSGGRLRCRRA